MTIEHTRITVGRVVETQQTRQFTATEMMLAKEREARLIFVQAPFGLGGMRERVAIAENKEFARRIVACWNAYQGVDTATLEQNPAPFSHIREDRDALLAQRNTFLAELEKFDAAMTACSDYPDMQHERDALRQAAQSARAAIAAVKGGAL